MSTWAIQIKPILQQPHFYKKVETKQILENCKMNYLNCKGDIENKFAYVCHSSTVEAA